MALDTYDIATNWAGDPYGTSDTPGMVATSRWSTGVMTDDGVIGSPQQSQMKDATQSATPKGDPIVGFIIAALLTFLIYLVIHHFGKEQDDFANPKASAYTVGLTALTAAAGIPIVKILSAGLASTKLPGTAALNTYLQSS